MILIRRDEKLLPEKALEDAEAATQTLEGKAEAERVAYIKGQSKIWKAFKDSLSKMSYGKCWYSESNDPQSFFDIDHFRPKAEAKRDDDTTDPGYPWLAFAWKNFVLAAGRSNRLSTDEEEELVTGKSSWFPLMDGSPKASWEDRCEATEKPKLLDPTVKSDIDLVEIAADARIEQSRLCMGTDRLRVDRSIELYGLNLPRLREARARTMREVEALCESLTKTLTVGVEIDAAADGLPHLELVDQLRRKSLPDSPYSRAARAQLHFMGLGSLAAGPEDLPVQM
jgi:hypothetical protein